MSSDAKRAANARYLATLDRLTVRPSKEDGMIIREAAATARQSLQRYILDAVWQRMERDAMQMEQDRQQG